MTKESKHFLSFSIQMDMTSLLQVLER